MAAGVPVTYVPARNTVFLSYALAWAEVLDVRDAYIGVNAVDYSGYPDCRPEFVAAFEALANLATKMTTEPGSPRFRVHAPLVHLTKAQIIRRGVALHVDYGMTHSCYDRTRTASPAAGATVASSAAAASPRPTSRTRPGTPTRAEFPAVRHNAPICATLWAPPPLSQI